jgi:hypothetical protein
MNNNGETGSLDNSSDRVVDMGLPTGPPVTETLDDVLRQPVLVPYRSTAAFARSPVVLFGSTAYLVVGLSTVLFVMYSRFGLTQAQGSWAGLGVILAGSTVGVVLLTRKQSTKNDQKSRDGHSPGASNDSLIATYHQMTVRQSSTSFRNSQVAMGVGLAILVAGTLFLREAANPTVQLLIGGLTALGSTFTAYLSKTFLRSHERALEQVNYLFSQPLVSHYLEYSRQIAKDLSTIELRDSSLVKIVDRSLESAAAATASPEPSTSPAGGHKGDAPHASSTERKPANGRISRKRISARLPSPRRPNQLFRNGYRNHDVI